MSEALLDEIEAINSIYGANTLARSAHDPDPTLYVLTLPALGGGETGSASLRLQFPAEYPDVPPTVVGTHSAGSAGRRGAAARHLALFRDAVGEVYEPGQVCLFDAIEKVQELLAAAEGGAGGDGDGDGYEGGGKVAVSDAKSKDNATNGNSNSNSNHRPDADADADDLPSEPPEWTVSDALTENKSTFVARCARVRTPQQAAAFVRHLVATDRRVRDATHNMTAWRIRGAAGTGASYQDCDDDGETAAGGRLLRLMQLMDLWDVMVVVTRWYGGQKLGPRRFALINQAARDAFVKAGLVGGGEGGGGGGSTGGGKKKGGK